METAIKIIDMLKRDLSVAREDLQIMMRAKAYIPRRTNDKKSQIETLNWAVTMAERILEKNREEVIN